MAVALGAAMVGIPREHAALPAVARYAMEVALPRWGLTEPVNEVVYGTRGFDTFGETFLLLAAVVSVVLITRSARATARLLRRVAGRPAREQAETDPAAGTDRRRAAARAAERREQGERAPVIRHRRHRTPPRWARPAPETAEAMTVVVRTAIRIALPILAVAGLYLVAWGYSPGGGFPGGAVILGVLLLAYAGFGRRRISRVVRPGLLEAHRDGGRGGDHRDRTARPGAQGLVQRELAAAGRPQTIAVRRHRPAVLRPAS